MKRKQPDDVSTVLRDLPCPLPLIHLPSLEIGVTLCHAANGPCYVEQLGIILDVADRIAVYRVSGHWTLVTDACRTANPQTVPLLKLLAAWWDSHYPELLRYGIKLIVEPQRAKAHNIELTRLQNLHDVYGKRPVHPMLFTFAGIDYDRQVRMHAAHRSYMASAYPGHYRFRQPLSPVKLQGLLPGLQPEEYAPFLPPAKKPVDFERLLRKLRKTNELLP